MKNRILGTIIMLCLATLVFGQTKLPMGMHYQAIARDMDGAVMVAQTMTIKVEMVTVGDTEEVVYEETHKATSNQYGLLNLTIGQGDNPSGKFDDVPWREQNVWTRISIKKAEDADFRIVTSNKLYSVPYAFYAQEAGRVGPKQYNDNGEESTKGDEAKRKNLPTYGSTWSLNGNARSQSWGDKFPALGTTDRQPLRFITNYRERMRIQANGKIRMKGDLDVGGNTVIQKTLTVFQDVDLNTMSGNTTIGGPTFLKSTLEVDGVTDLESTLNVNNQSVTNLSGVLNVQGVTNLYNNFNVFNNSPSFLSGTLTVNGATTLNNTLNVVGNTTIGGATQINNTLGVTGNGIFNSNLNVGGNTTINGTTTIGGATTINNNLTSTGCLTVGSQSSALLKFNCGLGSNEERFDDYALRLSGENVREGMAITVKAWDPQNNFLGFFAKPINGGSVEMRGRIEPNNGFLWDDMENLMAGNDLSDPDKSKEGANQNGTSIDKDEDVNVNGNGTSNVDTKRNEAARSEIDNNVNTSTAANGERIAEFVMMLIGVVADAISFGTSFTSIFDPVDIFEAGLALAISLTNLGLYIGFTISNLGVAFESGAGDYAEWLPRTHVEEVMNFGDIVGVKGGEVSMALIDADKFMVVSAAPAMLGNMPQEEDMNKFEKIAFMGQVPVKVRGEVKIGDYILPSGDGDGLGIALAPDEMKAKDFQRIVGVAWEDSKEDETKPLFQFINTAVGINQNDMANIVDQMQMVMNHMQDAIAEVNPNYEGFKFNTDRTTFDPGKDYTVSPTHRSKIEEYFEGVDFENREELGAAVRDALVEVGGVDLKTAPVVERILTEPGYAEFAMEYYTAKMEEYQAMAARLQADKD